MIIIRSDTLSASVFSVIILSLKMADFFFSGFGRLGNAMIRSLLFWVLLILFDVINDFLFLFLFLCFLFGKDEILAPRLSENLIRTVKRRNR